MTIEEIEHTDLNGRKYRVKRDGDMMIYIGPPEGLVDELGLPEPLATRLHNILYARGIYNFASIARNPNTLTGAWQEALGVDVQRLTEALLNYEKEVRHE